MTAGTDWRTNYTICQHVAQDESLGTHHRGFRVCCESCERGGFLGTEELTELKGYGRLDVRTLPLTERPNVGR